MSGFEGYVFREKVAGDSVVNRNIETILADGRTPYQHYTIWKSPSQGVCITIDGDLQSTELDRATYHEALVHPSMILHGDPHRVLICGGGTGVTAMETLRYPGVDSVTMVDIDREFVESCQAHVPWWHEKTYEDPRLTVHYEDVFRFVERCDERFDVILGDLTDLVEEVSPGKSFHSPAFYGSLKRLLRPKGVLCTQASALSLLDYKHHLHIREAIASQFGHGVSYRAHHDTFFAPWSFVMAGPDPFPPVAELASRFRHGFRHHGLDLLHFDPESLAACFALNRRIREKLAGNPPSRSQWNPSQRHPSRRPRDRAEAAPVRAPG
jgi:spermidine synthase